VPPLWVPTETAVSQFRWTSKSSFIRKLNVAAFLLGRPSVQRSPANTRSSDKPAISVTPYHRDLSARGPCQGSPFSVPIPYHGWLSAGAPRFEQFSVWNLARFSSKSLPPHGAVPTCFLSGRVCRQPGTGRGKQLENEECPVIQGGEHLE
jgi:hypothetical protein